MEQVLNHHILSAKECDVIERNKNTRGGDKSFCPYPRMAIADNLDFLSTLPDQSVQLIITSPPYNIGKSYEKNKSIEKYLALQKAVIAECVRVLHPGGSICWQVGNYVQKGEIVPLDILLYPIFSDLGLKMRN